MRLLLILAVSLAACSGNDGTLVDDAGAAAGDASAVDGGIAVRCDENECNPGEVPVCVYESECFYPAFPECDEVGFRDCIFPGAHLECMDSDAVIDVGEPTDWCDPLLFCDQVIRLECERAFLRGESSAEERDACVAGASGYCSTYEYPGDSPNSQDCVDTLSDPDNLQVPVCAMQECIPYWTECKS